MPGSPQGDFGSLHAAAPFCPARAEVQDYFRHRARMRGAAPLASQREQLCARLVELRALFGTVQRPATRGQLRPAPVYECDS